MSARRLELTLWSIAGALVITAGLGARRSAPANDAAREDHLLFSPASAERRAPSAEARSSLVDHDPFRLDRHPSPVAYRPELEGVAPPPPPPRPPEPQLILAGILGGPPWEALVEGIPEKNGAVVVHEGDVFGKLRVRSVRRDSVIIQGADTTWRLGLKRSWQ